MALNWNIDQIKDFKTVCYRDGQMRSLTDQLIWATMLVDLNEITDKNIDDWLARMHICSRVYGTAGAEDVYEHITREQLESHIGLRTNASKKTFKQFMKKVTLRLERAGAEYAAKFKPVPEFV